MPKNKPVRNGPDGKRPQQHSAHGQRVEDAPQVEPVADEPEPGGERRSDIRRVENQFVTCLHFSLVGCQRHEVLAGHLVFLLGCQPLAGMLSHVKALDGCFDIVRILLP